MARTLPTNPNYCSKMNKPTNTKRHTPTSYESEAQLHDLATWQRLAPEAEPLISANILGSCGYLHRYPDLLEQRSATSRASESADVCTLRSPLRSIPKIRSILAVHAALSVNRYPYLVTYTAPPSWDVFRRRDHFALLLDALRKLPYYLGHIWTTERHKSGLIHQHIYIRFATRWEYAPTVNEWSIRYCGSSNGLDIQPIIGDYVSASNYVAKTLNYLTKSPILLPSSIRWWGTSYIARCVSFSPHSIPTKAVPHGPYNTLMLQAFLPRVLSLIAFQTTVKEANKANKRLKSSTVQPTSISDINLFFNLS